MRNAPLSGAFASGLSLKNLYDSTFMDGPLEPKVFGVYRSTRQPQ